MPLLYHENDTPWGYVGAGLAGWAREPHQVPELRDDVAADGLEVGRDVVVAEAEVHHVLGAGIGEFPEPVDDLRRGLAAEVDVLERGALRISSGSRPTAAQCSARIAYLRAMPSGASAR